jgi:hypothetical protein
VVGFDEIHHNRCISLIAVRRCKAEVILYAGAYTKKQKMVFNVADVVLPGEIYFRKKVSGSSVRFLFLFFSPDYFVSTLKGNFTMACNFRLLCPATSQMQG